jgi:hypothetical protein
MNAAMTLCAATLIAGFFVWFWWKSLTFRISIVAGMGLSIFGGGIWLLSGYLPSKSIQMVAPLAEELIRSRHVSLRDVVLQQSHSNSGYFQVSGLIQNNSPYATLLGFEVEITANKCWFDGSCTIRARSKLRVPVDVPPATKRPFEISSVRLVGIPDDAVWNWAIVSTYAEEDVEPLKRFRF